MIKTTRAYPPSHKNGKNHYYSCTSKGDRSLYKSNPIYMLQPEFDKSKHIKFTRSVTKSPGTIVAKTFIRSGADTSKPPSYWLANSSFFPIILMLYFWSILYQKIMQKWYMPNARSWLKDKYRRGKGLCSVHDWVICKRL